MILHVCRVVSQPGPNDRWAHLAVCACGWREVSSDLEEAAEMAVEHSAAHGLEGKQP